MLISYDFSSEYLYKVIHELIRIAFPGAILMAGNKVENADLHIQIKSSLAKDKFIMDGFIRVIDGGHTTILKEEYLIRGDNVRNLINRNMRKFTFALLSKHLGKPVSSYGVLTGVRPLKIVHRLIEDNYTEAEIRQVLENDFHLQAEKAALLTEVAYTNHPYLLTKEEASELVSVYIGIPYCPSRCYYCSFPGYTLKNYDNEITPFLKILFEEIKLISTHLKAHQLQVQTIYIGGGTPTILTEADLAQLLDLINKYLKSEVTQEFTVEAGRPDTLSIAKLKILKDGGVNRLCINPQTMNDNSLSLIGRKHTAEEIVETVTNARAVGIDIINMDIIVGLFNEGEDEFKNTAQKIIEIRPENLTVHTLALKKGSTMAIKERHNMEMRVKKVGKGVKYFKEVLSKSGYIPYYLYRQKYMRGDMENLGYSLPDKFCLYNILMIEERQTIIGLGGGAASKFLNLLDWSFASVYNPKEPQAYLESMEKLVIRKVDKLMGLN